MKFGQKAKETIETTVDLTKDNSVSTVTEPLDLNSTAFSVTRNPEGGFALVEIKYNPITMQSKVESVKKVSDSREEAEYYFRVRVGEYFADQERNS